MQRSPRLTGSAHSRPGFTLVELLVVAAIMITLTGVVVYMYNSNLSNERVRGAARTMQSNFMVARDRAFHRQAPAGLRFVPDAADPSIVRSVMLVAPTEAWTEGYAEVRRPDSDGNNSADSDTPNILIGYDTFWYELSQRGLLVPGSQIEYPRGSSGKYTVYFDNTILNASNERLILIPNFNLANNPMPAVVAGNAREYSLALPATLMTNEKALPLPQGVVIDLDYSRIPGSTFGGTDPAQAYIPPGDWFVEMSYDTSSLPVAGWTVRGIDASDTSKSIIRKYSPTMDLLFTPRGDVIGSPAAKGIIHLVLAEALDTDLGVHPSQYKKNSTLVSLFTRTGNVIVSPLYTLGADGAPGTAGTDDIPFGKTVADGVIDDEGEIGAPGTDDVQNATLYRYAELGKGAGK